MANVLVLKSSINGETSLTNQLINEFLAARQAAGHGDRLTEHDLSAMALPTLDRPLLCFSQEIKAFAYSLECCGMINLFIKNQATL